MSRQERFGTRDLTYSAWHRRLEDDLTYIDVDGLEYCRRCRAPLALIELARDVGQGFKATPVIRQLATRSGVPAYLVFYKPNGEQDIERFRVAQLWPIYTDTIIMSPDKYASFLRSLRSRHECARQKVALR